MGKHKHAEVIKAWADGADVQIRVPIDLEQWVDVTPPPHEAVRFFDDCEYRIKPKKKQVWARPWKHRGDKPHHPPSIAAYFTDEEPQLVGAEWIGPAVLVWEEE